MAKWLLRNKKGDTKLMSQTFNISETLAQIFINRSINTKNKVEKFLHPYNNSLNNPYKIKDMDKSIDIIKDSIKKGEKIAVYGDYDVDGIMSTTILYKGLQGVGANVSYYIPDRKEEGYGLNINAINNLKKQNIELIIACDNGIAALEEIKHANLLGIKTIIIDHHEPVLITDEDGKEVEVLPEANSIINTKQKTCDYPFKSMCAAGVCYRFICTYYEHNNIQLTFKNEILAFATIATFCDIVDLQDENRIIVAEGLKILNSEIVNLGLKSLIYEKNYKEGFIDEYAIGFIIGPCINATGRLKHAYIALELFLTEDKEKADKLSKEIALLNEERKQMTKKAIDDILEEIAVSEYKDDNVLVVYNKNIHESIAGIVAGRVKDKLYRPTIILTQGDNMVKGSARSIEMYNIFEALSQCRHLFAKFGGHEMAAGLSLSEDNITQMRINLNENFNLTEKDLQEIIIIEKQLDLEDVTYSLAEELNILRPFGKNNKEPIFGTKSVKVEEIRILEEKNTIIFTFNVNESYRKIKGICFGEVDKFKDIVYKNFDSYDCEKIFNGILRTVSLYLDIVYFIDINNYNGNTSVQLKIKDFRISI